MESDLKQRTVALKDAWCARGRRVSYVSLDFWTITKAPCSLRVSMSSVSDRNLEYEGDTVDELFTRAYADLAAWETPEEKAARDAANFTAVTGIKL